MASLILLGVVVFLAFTTIFFVHYRKVVEEKRIQTERKIQDIQTQVKRLEPLVTQIRPHLLPYDLRSALAERWMTLLQIQQDAGDKSEAFLLQLKKAEQLVREVKANSNPKVEPIESQAKGQEAMNQLKNVQFLIMREFREGKLSETRGQEFLTSIRYAATQVVIEMNKSLAAIQLENKKYRAALIYYQNIIKELKKYRGTEQEYFSNIYDDIRKTMEEVKVKAQQEQAATPNRLAEGMDALEKEEAEENGFKSDMQRAITAGKAKARSQQRG